MNKVLLIGRLTRDPEVRYGGENKDKAVARYTLAVERRFKKDGDDTADFINCTAFGRGAEFADSKGAAVGTPDPNEGGFNPVVDGIDEELPFN